MSTPSYDDDHHHHHRQVAAGVLAEYTQINENDAELAQTKVTMMMIMREIIRMVNANITSWHRLLGDIDNGEN